MSNYSDFLINYFHDLETVLVNDGRVILGSPDSVPTISGASIGYIEQSLNGTITNYSADRFYYLVGSGTDGMLTSTGSIITWTLPTDTGSFNAVVRSTKSDKTLSDPGYWNVNITNPYKLDPYTSLLCHFNGADNGSVFTDDSYFNHTISRTGSNVYTSSAYRIFGISSLYINGHYLTVPHHDALNFGSDEFTIDFWMYPTSASWTYTVLDKIIQGQGYGQYSIMFRHNWGIGWFGFMGRVGSSGPWDTYCGYTCGTTLLNKWSHVEVSRSGNTLRFFIDGVQKAITPNVGTFQTNTENLYIGWQTFDPNTFPGYIDELRISKGIARHTSDFTVYQKEFKSYIDSYTKLLLHMDGNTSTFKDFSSSPKTITAYGNATQTSTQFKFGYKSAYFDGTGDYLGIVDPTDLNLINSDFTIDFWIRTSQSPTGTVYLLSKSDGGTNNNNWSYHISMNTTGKMITTLYSGATGYTTGWGTQSINNGNWHHVAGIRNGSTLNLYIDGVLDATANIGSISANSVGNFYLGGYNTFSGPNFNGYIDELRISKGIARWTSNFTPSTVAYY